MTVQYQGVWSLASAAQLQSTQRWVTDPLFDYTTLLLQADDAANGAQNNTFLDSSSNNFSITRNGNTTQGSFTPFSLQPGAWGNYFGGSDALTIPSTAALTFGTGDFCVEFWLYRTGSSTCGLFSNSTGSGGGDAQFEIQLQTTTTYVSLLGWNTVFMTGVTPINTNTWYHIAVLRSGTSMAIFVNGKRDATATSANNFSNANGFNIGRQATGTGNLTGYISNLRAVKGASVYSPASTSITIPLDPLTAITNTSLLTCQSNRFIDNSANAFTITTVGTPSVQAFSPFAPQYQYTPTVTGGSGYFDGSDALTVPDDVAFTMGNGNFTLEAWVYVTATSGSQMVFGTCDAAGTQSSMSFVLQAQNSSGFPTIGVGQGGTMYFATSSETLVKNQWNHLAGVRNGATVTIYVNGVSRGTLNMGTLSITDSTQVVGIGKNGAGNFEYLTGYISNARIVKGVAVYTGNFTPPRAPLSTSGSASAAAYSSTTNVDTSFVSSATSLLTNFTNAGIYDGTLKNNLETVGNAQISTAVVKYGSGSLAFDGTGDYLTSFNGGGLFRLGTIYTVEMWFYTTTVAAGNAGLINFATTVSGNTGFNLYRSTAEILCNDGVTGGTGPSSGAGSVVANVWTHLAIVSNGVTTKVYLNGVERGSYTGTTGSANSMTYVTIGAFNDKTSAFAGYIDDLRITRGIARYTSNFIPPSVALPRQ